MAVRFDGVANALITAAAALVLVTRSRDGASGLSAGMAGVALTQSLQLVPPPCRGMLNVARVRTNLVLSPQLRHMFTGRNHVNPAAAPMTSLSKGTNIVRRFAPFAIDWKASMYLMDTM